MEDSRFDALRGINRDAFSDFSKMVRGLTDVNTPVAQPGPWAYLETIEKVIAGTAHDPGFKAILAR